MWVNQRGSEMTKFSKDVLTQVAGVNGQIIAQTLYYNQKDFWNIQLTQNPTSQNGWVTTSTPLDLTGATISAEIIRRTITNFTDTRCGLDFDISDYSPTPTAIVLPITDRVDSNGSFKISLDVSTWGIPSNDPDIDIAAPNPAGFTGRLKISYPAQGNQPAYDEIVQLLFIVSSDGVIN